jgi:hypothetical protein
VAWDRDVTGGYELTTSGGATDFARLIDAREAFSPYCLIGGLAVNCYARPVNTLDTALVIVAANLSRLAAQLSEEGFKIEEHAHSVDARPPESDLRIRFTAGERYQPFSERSVETQVLAVRARVACLDDVTGGKLWAWSDPHRRLSRRKKCELDLIRLAEAYPELKSIDPPALREVIDRG